MKNLLFLLLTLVITSTTFSFKRIDPIVVEYILMNNEAEFPGGKAKMIAWIKENLRLPKENVRYGVVLVEFTVKKSGKLSDFVIKKGINEDMDFSAVECLQGMPLWEPATDNGKKINSQVTIPVKFSADLKK